MTLDTSNFNNINNTQNSLLQQISTGSVINSASDNAASLAIADQLDLQSNAITQSIANSNSGIAMSNIAEAGIANQKDLLENIRTETLKAMNGTTSQAGRDAIADQINKYIDQYEQIADSTNYNGETLLKTSGDSTDELSIVGDESIVAMEKADTTSVSDNLRSFMNNFSTNRDSMNGILDTVDDGMNTLSSQASEFGSASNALESMTRNYMASQTAVESAQSTVLDFDYASGIADFNKTNIQSQLGYLVQSQAHAVQRNVVSLLS